jgi:hypothetical protein
MKRKRKPKKDEDTNGKPTESRPLDCVGVETEPGREVRGKTDTHAQRGAG